MPLQKQPINISFDLGLDKKTDSKQIQIGKFLSLENKVFNKGKLLEKRNGFGALPSLPDTTSSFTTTFNENLLAVGSSIKAYSEGAKAWFDKGSLQPVQLSTLPLIRNNTNQSQCDSVTASNGLLCAVYTNVTPSATVYQYSIMDSTTGQVVVAPTAIPVASGAVTGSPRVFLLGSYFMIVFTNVITAVNHLQYIAVSTSSPTTVTANTDISGAYTPNASVAFDGVVANNNLYLAWNGNDGGGAIRMTYIDSFLTQHSVVTFATKVCTMMSVCADTSSGTPIIWAAFYTPTGTVGYALAVNQILTTVLAPTSFIAAGTLLNVTCQATAGVLSIFYEVSNAYSYGSLKTNYIETKTVTQAGVVSSATIIRRSVGLASKAFTLNSVVYMLSAYSSAYQPTYFLLKSDGTIVAKLAYSNGGGYLAVGLPQVTVSDTIASVAYLRKDLIQPINKAQAAANTTGVYSQTGINLASFDFTAETSVTAEVGGNLHLSGGFVWAYDGSVAVEQGFHLWPDNVVATTSGSGGLITAQTYYYVATYEWADNQGNVFRSAGSLPSVIVTTGTTSTNTIKVPTLRLTAKTANAVKICLYRWSTAQQTYYEVTSIATPTLSSTTTDSISFSDTLADSAIIGNNILYTTGGVIENIGPPATSVMALYRSRLFLVDAEDKNLIWYSKQVIESTPVEMSDLFTFYVTPTLSAQGNTGPVTAISAMDDKLIIFKKDAIYYMTGTGPDNTGANNDFSEPVFITSTIGCENPASIVYMPNGLMFQSDKGIWLLGRDLSTTYIGVDVEGLEEGTLVLSALTIPATNQVRFTLDSGLTLMYDYYFQQWGSFTDIAAISSTLYQGLHTFINSRGEVYQETPNLYLDGSRPTLMSLTTGWINPAGLQGYQRAYFFYLLGTYKSPHKLRIEIAYDYEESASQVETISPDNYSESYGEATLYGSAPTFGGKASLEQFRIFFSRQKCQAFQITIRELYDPTLGVAAGAGLTLSGLNLVVGLKSGYPRLSAGKQV